MDALIQVKNVSKSYKKQTVVKNVSFDIEKGKSYGIKGYNGSGKSVLLKLIAGYAFPDSGEIVIDGKILKKDIDFIQNAGVVINAPEFIGGMSAFKNLKYLAEIKRQIGDKEILEILEKFQLSAAKNKRVSAFSQGLKQRLRLAQALMESPDILLLDEPMNALDKEGVKLVKSILKEHVAQGKTLIFTSHSNEDFSDLADVCFEIDSGILSRIDVPQ